MSGSVCSDKAVPANGARTDRVKPFLLKHMGQFSFDEFSEGLLKSLKAEAVLSGIPVPLRAADIEAFKAGKDLPVAVIAENMAWVIGIDPEFVHAAAYITFITKFTGKRAVELFVKIADIAATQGAHDEACIHYRAALGIKRDDENAIYGYARVCRAIYNSSMELDVVGSFKAEALEYLEILTELRPKFEQGWYYLGYMYLNMGLYTKAQLAWDKYLLIAKDKEARREIRQRLEQIRVPIEIERGTNQVLSGRYSSGIAILEAFSESVYKDWWPLWYYLGEAYRGTGRDAEALEAYRRVLRLDGTNIQVMEKLLVLYAETGNEEMLRKYANKIALLKNTETEAD